MVTRTYITLDAPDGDHDEHVIDPVEDVGAEVRAISATVHPGAGGNARLSVSCRSPEDIRAGNADWVGVAFGGEVDVSAAQGSELPRAINGIRLSATSAAAKAHISII